MLIFVGMVLSILASLGTYFGFHFHEMSPWYLFLLVPFLITYFVIYLNIYWLIVLISIFPYRNNEFPGKVNKFCLFNIRLTASFCLTLRGIFVKKKNLDLIPKKPSLILFNHISDYDPWVLYKIMKGTYSFVGKIALRNIPMVRCMASSIGTLFVDNDNRELNYQMVDHAVEYIKNKNTSVVIAPEGTRNKTGQLMPFKHGGFSIAIRSECPIVLIGFKGMEKAVDKSNMKKAKVFVEVFDVIQPEEYKGKTAKEVAELCQKKYQDYLGQ